MNPDQTSRAAKLFWLVLLTAFWAFYGLDGRDAWKADEAQALAPILDTLAHPARVWHAPAPLHVWVAAVTAKLASPWLPVQDGARLASGVFTLASLLFTGLAARRLFGSGFSVTAVLALIGCLGLMLRMHALAPETALLAAWSSLLAGIACSRDSVRQGGVLIGLALTALALGLRGVPDLVAALGLLLLLPLLSPDWRRPVYRSALAFGLSLAAVACVAALVYLQAGGQLGAGLHWHGLHRLAAVRPSFRVFSELPWFAWPIWPLALAALWHEHRRLGRARELHLPVLALLAAVCVALWPSWSRDGGMLPLLLPLALLAAYGVDSMKRGAAQAFYWFGVVCFVFFIMAFWIYFSALEWGVPAKLSAHVLRLTPSYRPGMTQGVNLMLAMAATVLWLAAIPLFPRAKIRPVLVWASGMVLVWTLLIALFGPWLEAGWGYRPVLADLQRHLPAGACLNSETDAAMRTMLRYHLHPRGEANCPWLLVSAENKVAADATLIWEGARPRQKQQRYRLYHLAR
jgi:4-amino-4-deoxy-L-arabinose transferase-like glycosyltransferase